MSQLLAQSKGVFCSVLHYADKPNPFFKLRNQKKAIMWPYLAALSLSFDSEMKWGATSYQFFDVTSNWISMG